MVVQEIPDAIGLCIRSSDEPDLSIVGKALMRHFGYTYEIVSNKNGFKTFYIKRIRAF